MDKTSRTTVADDPWALYVPDDEAPWILERVVSLHRRAGFAATWDEIQRDLRDGLKASIDRLLSGKARMQGVPEHFDRTASNLADMARSTDDPGRLKAWWVFHMLYGPDPLTERLTLMWHNHFTTSYLKVGDLTAMLRQNQMFRNLARAPFGKLLRAALRDPALLVWLDAHTNRKGHPNENLARELMELFTIGIGNYTERDVKEVARALTGWSVVDSEFRYVPSHHDDGEKMVLGRRGRWGGEDVAEMLLEHPGIARRLATRLCQLFFGEDFEDRKAVETLACGLRQRNLDIAWGVETVLRSRLFFTGKHFGTRVTGPVEYVVGAVRGLEMFDICPSNLVLADWAARLGQELFYPPPTSSAGRAGSAGSARARSSGGLTSLRPWWAATPVTEGPSTRSDCYGGTGEGRRWQMPSRSTASCSGASLWTGAAPSNCSQRSDQGPIRPRRRMHVWLLPSWPRRRHSSIRVLFIGGKQCFLDVPF